MDIVKVFEKVYQTTFDDPELQPRIQIVKDALFRRSYVEAFSSRTNLEAYVVRWSPSRALAYYHILSTKKHTRQILTGNRINCLCIGGGAGAEIAALSQFKNSLNKVTTLDIGDWAPVVKPLAVEFGLLNLEMINGDALKLVPQLKLTDFSLITCLFTTNELVTQSKQQFIRMFQSLSACKKGTLIVVIESAGSYSEVLIGKKTFPVYYLLHYSLGSDWELVEQVDSEWYRLPELNYKLELQNMRYFLRIYKRR